MSTMTQEDRRQVATYAVPDVQIGQTVYWYPDNKRSQKPSVAFVTDVGVRTVDIAMLQHGIPQVFCKEGVRHIDDPKARESEVNQNGCWDLIRRKPRPVETPST